MQKQTLCKLDYLYFLIIDVYIVLAVITFDKLFLMHKI